jgi:hypothetical protein
MKPTDSDDQDKQSEKEWPTGLGLKLLLIGTVSATPFLPAHERLENPGRFILRVLDGRLLAKTSCTNRPCGDAA